MYLDVEVCECLFVCEGERHQESEGGGLLYIAVNTHLPTGAVIELLLEQNELLEAFILLDCSAWNIAIIARITWSSAC